MGSPQSLALHPLDAIPRRETGVRRPAAVRRMARFPYEFWAICLIVSLGLVQAIPIGFYQFRLADLIIDLSLVYAVILCARRRLSKTAVSLLCAQVAVLMLRISLESVSLSDPAALRTLLGMGAIYLTPCIFFVVRESRVDRRTLEGLLIVSWIVSLLSQLGILPWGESYASGTVDLASLVGVTRQPDMELAYMETTITIWRALSVGVSIAALISRVNVVVKVLAVAALVLQFAGGGGGRSPLIFLFFAPLVLYLRPGSLHGIRGLGKMVLASVTGLALAGFYVWSPIGGAGPVKGQYDLSHYDRVMEIFIPLQYGWREAETNPGILNARTISYEQYWQGIISSAHTFWLGVGLEEGAAFQDTPNVLAHNMVLDVWALSGIVGLSLFLWFVAYVLRDLLDLLRATPKRGESQLLSLSVAAAVLYMFQWLLFQAATADRSFMIVFYLLSGLMRPVTIWLAARGTRIG